MKKIISILLCVVLLVLLCGCTNVITEGEVYEKEYREAHTQIRMIPLIRSNGKTSTVTMIPYVVRYPERYVIFIKAYQNEKWLTEDFYVSQDTYDAINIGDMFLYDDGRGDLKDEPYTKERKKGKEGEIDDS